MTSKLTFTINLSFYFNLAYMALSKLVRFISNKVLKIYL